MTFNPSKALIALVGLICMTVLIAVGSIDQDQGLPIITMIVGYSVGNGMAALTNKPVEPIVRPSIAPQYLRVAGEEPQPGGYPPGCRVGGAVRPAPHRCDHGGDHQPAPPGRRCRGHIGCQRRSATAGR